MSAPSIPTWQERLAACFRMRHRLMHVFGVPSAVGALTAVASSSVVSAQAGLALGTLTAGVGTVLAGWYVIVGFDKKLIEMLQEEKASDDLALRETEIQAVLDAAEAEPRDVLERIVAEHKELEVAFSEGSTSTVSTLLQGSRADLRALRDRAVAIVKLHKTLRTIIGQLDGAHLEAEVMRMRGELERTPDGSLRDALAATKDSTEKTLAQWRAAIDKEAQIVNNLTGILRTLEGFRLKMGLSKADEAMGVAGAELGVGELQASLAAAAAACDELVGRAPAARRRTSA